MACGHIAGVTCSECSTAPPNYFPGRIEYVPMPPNLCKVCGGKLATIRGKYPGDPDCVVCPTCIVERLEDLAFQVRPLRAVSAK